MSSIFDAYNKNKKENLSKSPIYVRSESEPKFYLWMIVGIFLILVFLSIVAGVFLGINLKSKSIIVQPQSQQNYEKNKNIKIPEVAIRKNSPHTSILPKKGKVLISCSYHKKLNEIESEKNVSFDKNNVKNNQNAISKKIEKKIIATKKKVENNTKKDKKISYKLEGIAGDKNGYIAIINDEIVGVGDFVDDAMVISIKPDKVVLKKDDKIFEISQ